MFAALIRGIEEKKAQFDRLRPLSGGALAQLQKYYDVEAHFRLTAIHPFSDGNGRAARLLMNLMLIRGGYPPVAVRPEDRKPYLDALERGSLADDLQPFRRFLYERLDATLGEYLSTLQGPLPQPDPNR